MEPEALSDEYSSGSDEGSLCEEQVEEDGCRETVLVRQFKINHLFNGFSCPKIVEMGKKIFLYDHRFNSKLQRLRMRSKTTRSL